MIILGILIVIYVLGIISGIFDIIKEIKNLDNYISSMVEYQLAQLKNQI